MQRHKFDQEVVEYNFDAISGRVERMVQKTARKTAVDGMDRIAGLAQKAISYLIVGKLPNINNQGITDQNVDNAELVYRNLYLFLQNRCNLATFGLSTASGVRLDVDDMVVDFPIGKFDKHHLRPDKWTTAYLYAFLGRETTARELLKKVPLDLIKEDNFQANAYTFEYIEFLKTVETPEAREKLTRVQQALNEATIGSPEYRNSLIKPQLDLWEAVLARDENAVNQALEAAVQKHHQYWSQKVDDDGGDSYRCNYETGFLAMNLASIAAHAFDQGIPITYTSDYLPRFMIEGYLKVNAKVRMPS